MQPFESDRLVGCSKLIELLAVKVSLKDENGEILTVPAQIYEPIKTMVVKLKQVFFWLPTVILHGRVCIQDRPSLGQFKLHHLAPGSNSSPARRRSRLTLWMVWLGLRGLAEQDTTLPFGARNLM